MICKVNILCLSAVFIKTISSQCVSKSFNNEVIGNIAAEAGLNGLASIPLANSVTNRPTVAGIATGSRFTVTSLSTIPTSGVTVQSENLVVEGPLAITGRLPFLGVVAMQGILPATGTGAVEYDCGNGNIGVLSEGVDSRLGPYSRLDPALGLNSRGLNGLSVVN